METTQVKIITSADLKTLEEEVNKYTESKSVVRISYDYINQQHVAYIEYKF